MNLDTDILIIGAGPTGLMLACQLLRFGINFKIIDKQADRSQESRAFGIQAKSMEIFQNLGIVDEFLKKSVKAIQPHFFVNGKLKMVLDFNKIKLNATQFSSIYFLPQSETEAILINYIENQGIRVQRQVVLDNFVQNKDLVTATLKNLITGETESIVCRYIVGCDGAHSLVRSILQIPFVGAAFSQKFFLADAEVKWPSDLPAKFMLFFNKTGILLHAPLTSNLSRIIFAEITSAPKKSELPLQLKEINEIAQRITHSSVSIEPPQWASQFHLHHRTVKYYQLNRAFLAGDAAHIHSPVGAQGMNTGLQDATNLAWKLALVIKKGADPKLLETYQIERQLVGNTLTNTTDKFFGMITSPNRILMNLRPLLLSLLMNIVKRSPKLQKKLFWFMSQLGIHYPNNQFTYQKHIDKHSRFNKGPKAGYRAPDAPIGETTLFEMLTEKPFNILIFNFNNNQISQLEQLYSDWIKFHKLELSRETKIVFKRYQVTKSALYFIRPDGYIGFRQGKIDINQLKKYLLRLFPVSTLSRSP